jgi:threonyl-tRNA synthetase
LRAWSRAHLESRLSTDPPELGGVGNLVAPPNRVQIQETTMSTPTDPSPAPDHRDLGNSLDLFHFQDDAPGMVFWHPRGLMLYRVLRDAARRRCHAEGYSEVMTPQVLREPMWRRSGHWSHYREDMFGFDDGKEPVALKPVSCPGHLEIVKRRSLSHRDLPLRISEFGLVHRREPSGALHGLFRLRQFTQDDGHIFCLPEQLDSEVERFAKGLTAFYRAFGFDNIDVKLSTRPVSRVGDDGLWTRAESLLRRAASAAGLAFSEQPGAGAFYGPKLEFGLEDVWGRLWQCGTIQLDLVLPERFGIQYASRDGAREVPLMLHRALFGSLERFMGVLLEHSGGSLAAWLAPEQVRVLPVSEVHSSEAQVLANALDGAQLRVGVDASPGTLALRVHRANADGVPFALILGNREVASRSATIRERGGDNRTLPEVDAVDFLVQQCRPPL